MKALLHLKDGANPTVDLLIDISEKLGDMQEFVNAAYTSVYYKGKMKRVSVHVQELGLCVEPPQQRIWSSNDVILVSFILVFVHMFVLCC